MKLICTFLAWFCGMSIPCLSIENLEEKIEKVTEIESLINLEDAAQDFVLDLKKINIPEFPTAFNPSITRWHGHLLLCFRIRDKQTGLANKIGFCWLDEDFNLMSEPKVLSVNIQNRKKPTKEQDPRLLVIQERLLIIYSDVLDIEKPDTHRMYVGEVQYDGENFSLEEPECLEQFEGEKPQRWEKNWVPFEYNEQLHLAYSIVPHFILRPVFGTKSCETVASSVGSVVWNWGHIRGGTPALKQGDEYLAFFHSSKNMKTLHSRGKNITHYFIGAYTFSASLPFQVTRISASPIIAKNFYEGSQYKTWKPLRCVFPCGYVADENFIWLAYGRQDHEVWIAKIDKPKLLNSLVPVHTIKTPN